MKIQGFIWLEEFVEKLLIKHNVETDEAEQVFRNRPKITKVKRGHVRGEDVYRALGQTEAGRYLMVVFIHKSNNKALVISARDMDDKEYNNYGKK